MNIDGDVRTAHVPDRATMVEAMRLAARAPSVHNTQPWLWRFADGRLTLTLDADRLLPSIDPVGRQMVISCGAMLHHVRTAFAGLGWHTDVVRVPDAKRPDTLAALTFRPWLLPPEWVHARVRAIVGRYSDRLPFRAAPGLDALLPTLFQSAARHHTELDVLAESARPRLAAASREIAAVRGHDLLHEAELHWWAGHSGGVDGIPASALVSEAESARVGIGRAFPTIAPSTRRPGLADHARLLMLSTAADSVLDWLRTGEALSEVLLECTTAGLATCSLTHLAEVPAGRDLLAACINRTALPQVLIRVGTAPADPHRPPPTPRRPIADFCTGLH
ncbi:Acg family FMN-binding oxidoreductase [Nocardia inohanensis]|uniref:Acg family FMN-binding oxidoreductase n=1 Tax=Nocardia inohanensis TaxID=209246 RepID=UPI00082DFE98|nr:hypothetical protein [Nocardia inohanensis]